MEILSVCSSLNTSGGARPNTFERGAGGSMWSGEAWKKKKKINLFLKVACLVLRVAAGKAGDVARWEDSEEFKPVARSPYWERVPSIGWLNRVHLKSTFLTSFAISKKNCPTSAKPPVPTSGALPPGSSSPFKPANNWGWFVKISSSHKHKPARNNPCSCQWSLAQPSHLQLRPTWCSCKSASFHISTMHCNVENPTWRQCMQCSCGWEATWQPTSHQAPGSAHLSEFPKCYMCSPKACPMLPNNRYIMDVQMHLWLGDRCTGSESRQELEAPHP